MDILESFSNINCTKHPNNRILFLQIKEIKLDKTLFYCQFCQDEDEEYKPSNYILLNRILEFSDDQIIDKWPPLQDNSLHNKIRQSILQNNETPSLSTEIDSFFESLKREIVNKIDEIKKKNMNKLESFSHNSVDIISRYQEISKTNQLKQILTDSKIDNKQKENQLRELIKQIESKKQENTEIINQLIQQSQQNQNMIDFQNSDKINSLLTQLIGQINIFSSDQNSIDSINSDLKNNTNSKLVYELISTKSNYCSEKFLKTIKSLLNQISPLIDNISFGEVFIEDKKQIDFSKLTNYHLELMSDYCKNFASLSNSTEEFMKNSPQIKQIMSVLKLKSNYLNQNFLNQFEKYLIDTYPLLTKIKFDAIFQQNQKIKIFQELTDETLHNIVQLIQKMIDFQINGNNAIQQTLRVKQKCLQLLQSDYLQEDLDKLYQSYPIFDLLNPNKKNDILPQMQMVKTNFQESQQNLQIIKNISNQISMTWINNGKLANCVSDFILDENANYVFRFQFINNTQIQKCLVIGLVRDSQKDLINGQDDNLSCFFYITQNQFYSGGFGIDKKEKGDFSLLRQDQKEVEMRVCIKDRILQFLDYPNYNHIISITDQHKSKLYEYKNLRLFISQSQTNLNINLIYASKTY